jgi:predicted nucleotidyltransferase
MLSPLERSALARFRRELEAAFGGRLAALTLFGSRARGEGDEFSDLDVLVRLTQLTRSDRRAVVDVAYSIELEDGVRIEPVVRDSDTGALGAALAGEIQQDGVAV